MPGALLYSNTAHTPLWGEHTCLTPRPLWFKTKRCFNLVIKHDKEFIVVPSRRLSKEEATMGFFHMRCSFYSMQTRFPWTWSRKSLFKANIIICLIFPGPIWSGPDTTRKNKEGSPDRGQVEPTALRMLSYQSTIMFVCSSVSALGWCRCLCEKKNQQIKHSRSLSPSIYLLTQLYYTWVG